jgi:hypothetical protein
MEDCCGHIVVRSFAGIREQHDDMAAAVFHYGLLTTMRS